MSDSIFPKGMFIKRHPKAPDFVIGKISVKLEDFIPFIQQHESNGWVNFDVKKKKGTNDPYMELDTWKPDQQKSQQAPQEQSFEQRNNLPTDDIDF